MRNAFADELTHLSDQDKRITLLSGDIGNRLFDTFKSQNPNRFYNCGIAEANMMGVAAGMALSGLRPFVYTITPFTTTRCFEQIRIDVCYHNAPVTIVGTGSGLSYAQLGPTHHSLEDLAILRTLPRLNLYAPCDVTELRLIMREVLCNDQPAYIRIGKKGEPDVHSSPPQLKTGTAIPVRKGQHVALLAVGTMVKEALDAAENLSAQGIEAEVVSFPSIKPLDTSYLTDAHKRFPLLITVEEHGIIGGFGSAVADWLITQQSQTALIRLGTADEFMHEVGHQDYAKRKFEISSQTIENKVQAFLKTM